MNTDQRSHMEEAITGTFMWSFKKGDNIIYNFEIVWQLYSLKRTLTLKDKPMLIKPIIIFQMAIVECILDDFVNRVRGHVNDRIPNISLNQIADFKIKTRDQLEQYIAASRKHDLFDSEDDFYNDMDILRKARNRLHIQNSKSLLPNNEHSLFNEKLLNMSERTIETVLYTMITKFYRGDRQNTEFSKLPLPWL